MEEKYFPADAREKFEAGITSERHYRLIAEMEKLRNLILKPKY